MNTIKKRDVAKTKKLGVNPILTKLCNLVLAPTAAIATNRHHLLKLLESSLIDSGTKLAEFNNAKKIKSITNIGIKGVFLVYFCYLNFFRSTPEPGIRLQFFKVIILFCIKKFLSSLF